MTQNDTYIIIDGSHVLIGIMKVVYERLYEHSRSLFSLH